MVCSVWTAPSIRACKRKRQVCCRGCHNHTAGETAGSGLLATHVVQSCSMAMPSSRPHGGDGSARRTCEGHDMAYWDSLQRLKHDVRAWNAWRHQHPEVRIDLRGVPLSRAHLAEADLSHVNLTG